MRPNFNQISHCSEYKEGDITITNETNNQPTEGYETNKPSTAYINNEKSQTMSIKPLTEHNGTPLVLGMSMIPHYRRPVDPFNVKNIYSNNKVSLESNQEDMTTPQKSSILVKSHEHLDSHVQTIHSSIGAPKTSNRSKLGIDRLNDPIKLSDQGLLVVQSKQIGMQPNSKSQRGNRSKGLKYSNLVLQQKHIPRKEPTHPPAQHYQHIIV